MQTKSSIKKNSTKILKKSSTNVEKIVLTKLNKLGLSTAGQRNLRKMLDEIKVSARSSRPIFSKRLRSVMKISLNSFGNISTLK